MLEEDEDGKEGFGSGEGVHYAWGLGAVGGYGRRGLEMEGVEDWLEEERGGQPR